MALDLKELVIAARTQGARLPVSDVLIRSAECQIGFGIPAPLRRIYAEGGDGAFGPGYGFYSLAEGTEDFPDENVVRLYTAFRQGDPEDPEFSWP